MKSCFRAVIHHDLNGADLCRLPRIVNRQWMSFRHMWGMSHFATDWSWELASDCSDFADQFASSHYVVMQGAAGFSLVVGEHAAVLIHTTPWYDFFTNKGHVRDKLRGTVRLFSGILGSMFSVYFPGDTQAGFLERLVRGGNNFNEALTWLQSHFGLPEENLDEMMFWHDGHWGVAGYFIEKFLERDSETEEHPVIALLAQQAPARRCCQI